MVGSIIAAIMFAHIGNNAPKVSIGIMLLPTGRPITSTPDIRAIMNITSHAEMIMAKNVNQPIVRPRPFVLNDIIRKPLFGSESSACQSYVRRLIV